MSESKRVSGRVRGLIRVSTGEQDAESQRRVLLDFAAREGFTFEEIVVEESRRRGQGINSKKFTKLIKEGEDGLYDWLVIDHTQRLGANDSDEYGYWVTQLKWAGVKVFAVNRDAEITKPDQATTILNTVDHIGSLEERVTLAEKVSRGVQDKAKKGFLPFSGKYVAGYDRECVSPSGEVLFKVVITGPKEKTITYPDGARVVLRSGTYPGRSKFDSYRPVKTEDPEQIALVKEIFTRFTTTAIAPYAIARDLQNRGVKNVQGTPWTVTTIYHMLRHPLYTGRLVFHRTASARYRQIDKTGKYVDGIRERKGGKGKARMLPEDEWVEVGQKEELRIIDDATWQEAQRRLAGIKTKTRRAPSVPELWLRPFVFCAGCGEPMHAYAQRKANRTINKYRCSSYLKYHHKPPSGCGPNYCKHETIEAAVSAVILSLATDRGKTLEAMEEPLESTGLKVFASSKKIRELEDRIKTELSQKTRRPIENFKHFETDDLLDAYRELQDAEPSAMQADLGEAYSDLEGLMIARKGITLGGPADRISLRQIAEAEKRIAELENAIVPLDKQVETLIDFQTQLFQNLLKTLTTLKEGENRDKAEALEKVLTRIEVSFKANTDRYREPKSTGGLSTFIPTKLRFFPVDGQPFDYTIVY